MQQPALYEIRVEGHLDYTWSEWFDGLEIIHEPSGETLLRGTIVDQAALYGKLARIQGLGLTLLSVNAINRSAQDGNNSNNHEGEHST
jgi:hypothetical protein